MNPEMEARYQALADFMEWVDPEGFAQLPLARPEPDAARVALQAGGAGDE